MLARGDLRHHTTVAAVHVDLCRHGVGEDAVAVLHDRGGRFVTGGFDTQDAHGNGAPMLACSTRLSPTQPSSSASLSPRRPAGGGPTSPSCAANAAACWRLRRSSFSRMLRRCTFTVFT